MKTFKENSIVLCCVIKKRTHGHMDRHSHTDTNSYILVSIDILEQECMPEGCVPPAPHRRGRGFQSRGISDQEVLVWRVFVQGVLC